MSNDEVIDFFREHSRNPIPQNVQFSIESWAGDYGSIYFENVSLMRFRDANTCSSVIYLPELASYVVERLSDHVLIVSSENIPKIITELKKAGYQPEQFGVINPPDGNSEQKFVHSTINALREKNKIPEMQTEFIFPETIPEDENSQ